MTDDQIMQSYRTLGSVWKVAAAVGLVGQTVHVRLTRLGVKLKNPQFSKEDWRVLQQEYPAKAAQGKLTELAGALGRTKQFICRKAKEIGLTAAERTKPWLRTWKGMSEERAQEEWERFKRTPLGLGQYCAKYGIDDLGFSKAMKAHFADEWEGVIESKANRQTQYRLGRAVEYAVRDHLKKNGYPMALRSPRSGGPLDILAVRKGLVLFVQCKRGMALGPAEWNVLFDLAESVGAVPILAGRPTGHGLVYKRMVGKKDGTRKRQPMVDYDPAKGADV